MLGTHGSGQVQARRADLADLAAELIMALLLDYGGCADAAAAQDPDSGRASEPGSRPGAATPRPALGAAASAAAAALEVRTLLACAVQAMGHLIPLLHAAPGQADVGRCTDPHPGRAVDALVALWRCALRLPGLSARALPAAMADALAHVVCVACTLPSDPCFDGAPGALGAHSAAGRVLAYHLLEELLRALHADVLRAGQSLGFWDVTPEPSASLSDAPRGGSAVLVRLARGWAHLVLRAPPDYAAPAASQLAAITALLDPKAGCVTPIALSLGITSALRSAAGADGLELHTEDAGRLSGVCGTPSAVPPGCAAATLRLWAVAADALARGLADGRHATSAAIPHRHASTGMEAMHDSQT